MVQGLESTKVQRWKGEGCKTTMVKEHKRQKGEWAWRSKDERTQGQNGAMVNACEDGR